MNITVLGVDLAKKVFQVHGIDKEGKPVARKRLMRDELSNYIANLPPCLIGLEASMGAHYWARKFISYGHEVKLINPRFVKPYVKSNKNDRNDAEAICEAVTRPNMRFVAIKETKQQDILALHRVRERVIKSRTALVNQIRGLLAENGIVLNQQIQTVRRELMEVVQNEELSEFARSLFKEQYEELLMLDERIEKLEVQLKAFFESDIRCKRLEKIPGIGIITASVLVAAIGDPKLFKNGRELAAWVGLVPRQASSGNKKVLLGISKRGDRYLRTLLIHGARASLSKSKNKEDERSVWINQVRARRGFNKACVALANKNVRTVWALLAKGEGYRQAA